MPTCGSRRPEFGAAGSRFARRRAAACAYFAAACAFFMAPGVPPALFGAAAQAADPHPVVTRSRVAKFDDVRDDLKLAIEGKGLVIDYHSHVNRMLERTGRDVGSDRRLYLDAQAFVFCSAALSRKTMEADPANMSMCPYSIAVYTTVQQPDRVFVSYRRPWRPDGSAGSKAALREVEALLEALAREALGIGTR